MDTAVEDTADETNDWVNSAFDWDDALIAYPEDTEILDPSQPKPGPANRCLFIPEILTIVIDFLDAQPRNDKNGVQEDLVSCSKVSRLWYSVANPILYARPWFGASGQNFTRFVGQVAPRTISPRSLQLSSFIRDLDLSRLQHHGSKATTARLISRTRHNLRAFTAPFTQFGTICIPALCRTRQLQYLDIHVKGGKKDSDFTYKETSHMISLLQNLRWLSMPRRMRDSDYNFRDIRWPPKLQHLSLNRQSHIQLVEAAIEKPTSVTSLRVESQFVGPAAFAKIPQLFPNLESLTIRGYGEAMDNIGAFDHIPLLLPNLKHLRIPTGLITPQMFTKNYASFPPSSPSHSPRNPFFPLHTLELDFYVHPVKPTDLSTLSPYYNPVFANATPNHHQQANLALQQLQQLTQTHAMMLPNNFAPNPQGQLANAWQTILPTAGGNAANNLVGFTLNPQTSQLLPVTAAATPTAAPAPPAPANTGVPPSAAQTDFQSIFEDIAINDGDVNDNHEEEQQQEDDDDDASDTPMTDTTSPPVPQAPTATNPAFIGPQQPPPLAAATAPILQNYPSHTQNATTNNPYHHRARHCASNPLSITPTHIWDATTTGGLGNLRRLRIHKDLHWTEEPTWQPMFRLMCKHLLACWALDRERGEEVLVLEGEAGVRQWGEVFVAGRDWDSQGNEV